MYGRYGKQPIGNYLARANRSIGARLANPADNHLPTRDQVRESGELGFSRARFAQLIGGHDIPTAATLAALTRVLAPVVARQHGWDALDFEATRKKLFSAEVLQACDIRDGRKSTVDPDYRAFRASPNYTAAIWQLFGAEPPNTISPCPHCGHNRR